MSGDNQEQREEYLHAGDIANSAAKIAVQNVFAILGVDIDDPRQVEEFRQDLRFGGRLRRAADKGFMMSLGVGICIVLITAWTSISAKFWGA